jgi:drug/metabolite transporter (DMT)-like permease
MLLLMVLIWGANYSIVKHAFSEIDPQAFNAVRMILASLVFGALIWWVRSRPPGAPGSLASVFRTPARVTRSEWLQLAALGVIGHCLYQYFFVEGLAHTSVTNSSLLLAATPIIIALVSAVLGRDRIGALHWIGVVLSVAGIYVVVGHRTGGTESSLGGDLMMLVAVGCWAAYTLGSRELIVRHSPVGVTGVSMAIGTALYVPAMSHHVLAVHWSEVSAGTWAALVYSALFSLAVAYTIWYAAVRELGSARTSVYSNLVPLVAIAAGVLFLGEPLNVRKIAGAAAVLLGVALTRVRMAPAPEGPPRVF